MELIYQDKDIVVCVKPARVLSTDEPGGVPELVRQELLETLEHLLAALNERQQQVLRLHFGMVDGTCHSLEQISRHLGVSKERVRQIEQQAIAKLQKLGSSMGLEDFLS